VIIRAFVAAIVLSCLTASVRAESSPAPEARSAPPQASAKRKPAPTTRPAAACDIGVIATVGDEFQVKQIGLLHIGSEPTDVPIGHWGLDDLAFERVRAAAGPGAKVRRIPYRKGAFPEPKETKFTLFRDLNAELAEMMRLITNGTNCQRYVVVGRSISRFNDSALSVRGIGIVDWNNPLPHRTFLHALSFIRVFDGRDFTILRQGSAIIEREPLLNRMLLGETILGPYRELDNSAFPANPADAAHNRAFREGVSAMLRVSLDKTLPIMLQARSAGSRP
jgi:hypothetical protein